MGFVVLVVLFGNHFRQNLGDSRRCRERNPGHLLCCAITLVHKKRFLDSETWRDSVLFATDSALSNSSLPLAPACSSSYVIIESQNQDYFFVSHLLSLPKMSHPVPWDDLASLMPGHVRAGVTLTSATSPV